MLRVAFIDFYRGLGMLKSFRFHTFSTFEAQSAWDSGLGYSHLLSSYCSHLSFSFPFFLPFHSSSVLRPFKQMFMCFLCPISVFMLTWYVALFFLGHCHFKLFLQSILLHFIVACIWRHASRLAVNSFFRSCLYSF
jgi:hypothetical protein